MAGCLRLKPGIGSNNCFLSLIRVAPDGSLEPHLGRTLFDRFIAQMGVKCLALYLLRVVLFPHWGKA